jgi:hypothetical protein
MPAPSCFRGTFFKVRGGVAGDVGPARDTPQTKIIGGLNLVALSNEKSPACLSHETVGESPSTMIDHRASLCLNPNLPLCETATGTSKCPTFLFPSEKQC